MWCLTISAGHIFSGRAHNLKARQPPTRSRSKQATVELPGVKGCWSLRTGDAAVSDTYLVMSFIGETRILAINDEDELDETEFEGFSAEEQTLVWGAVHVVATSFDPRI